MDGAKFVLAAPEGGYGWVIVFSMILNNFASTPLIQSFGLLYKSNFDELGLTATEESIIINVNAAFGMTVALINGPLLNKFGFRKVALASAFLITTGVVLTSFGSSFYHFLISYGFIMSLGISLAMSAYNLAVNTYFSKNRGRALGIVMTLTGLAPIAIPPLITYLSKIYTTQQITFILGAFAFHCFVSGLLLQPVKWHMRKEIPSSVEEEQKMLNESLSNNTTKTGGFIPKCNTINEFPVRQLDAYENYDNQSMGYYSSMSMDISFGGSVLSLHTIAPFKKVISLPRNRTVSCMESKDVSKYFIDLKEKELKSCTSLTITSQNHLQSQEIAEKQQAKAILKTLISTFQLDLLKDPVYVNIMLGMSMTVFVESNFANLTPFILSDYGLDMSQTAMFMSVLAVVDLMFRFLAPFIGEFLNQSPRFMYACSMVLLIIGRFMLMTLYDYAYIVAFVVGIAKGIRIIYLALLIPSHVPLEKLASASGIQMVVNGIFTLIGGTLLGVVRDVSGSYAFCLLIMNFITFLSLFFWTLEYFINRNKPKTSIFIT